MTKKAPIKSIFILLLSFAFCRIVCVFLMNLVFKEAVFNTACLLCSHITIIICRIHSDESVTHLCGLTMNVFSIPLQINQLL